MGFPFSTEDRSVLIAPYWVTIESLFDDGDAVLSQYLAIIQNTAVNVIHRIIVGSTASVIYQ